MELRMSSTSLAKLVRSDVIKMAHASGLSHVGSSLSCVDLLSCVYSEMLHDFTVPISSMDDVFLLSKGHATSALYAVLWRIGFFPGDLVSLYGQDGENYMSHVSNRVPGVSFSFGSLGHGPPIGLGIAWAQKQTNARKVKRTFVLVGDGELAEGSIWEALLLAEELKASNLVLIVDMNGIQSLGSTPPGLTETALATKLRAFGCQVSVVDGHDHLSIKSALTESGKSGITPWAIVCRTVKGKGVSFMENELLWHYRAPDDTELDVALAEVLHD